MAKKMPFIRKMVGSNKNEMNCKEQESTFVPLNMDSGATRTEGWNPALIILDEASLNKDKKFVSTLKRGLKKSPNSYMIFITTASGETDTVWLDDRTRLMKNFDEDNKSDGRDLALLYEPDKDDDLHSEETWKKVNPGLGITKHLIDMRDDYNSAKDSPSDLNEFFLKEL